MAPESTCDGAPRGVSLAQRITYQSDVGRCVLPDCQGHRMVVVE